MKRLVLIIICTFLWIGTIIAELDPFVVPGYPTIVVWPIEVLKSYDQAFWHTSYHTSEGEIFNLTYKIIGDSVVNEKSYGKMHFYYETKEDLLTGMGLYRWGQPFGKTEFADTLLYRQEGDKVFCLPKGENEDVLVVDYGLQVGDEFVDSSGEKFRVTETRFLKDKYDDKWTIIGSCYVMCHYFYSAPKVLELVSLTSGERDTWVEGLGSLNWGVVPMYIAERIEPFSHLKQHPQYARVCVASPENMDVMPNIKEEDYKAIYVTDCKYTHDEEELYIEYSFEADTLCVNGIQNSISNIELLYAECLITDNHIDFRLKQRDAFPNHDIYFNVRIPGFKAGVYEVGMPGREYVTLECKGATTGIEINEVKNEGVKSEKYTNETYDLQGRKVIGAEANSSLFTLHSSLKKGLYIVNGRKIAVKRW